MCIATPLRYGIIKKQRSIACLVADGPADNSIPYHRIQLSGAVNGVRWLSRRRDQVLEITIQPPTCLAPVHSTNPLDTFRGQHFQTTARKIDVLENTDAERLTRLI
jgi:hypothetical protein